MPRLSIIIPTFNSAKTLSRCLDSVISQSFTDWEVLMMDGVSNDDTIKIASSYQDARIRICSEPDKGIYDAMNKGIDKAQGEWLYFLGSDDWLLNNCVLEEFFFTSKYSEYDVIYGDVESSLNCRHNGEWKLDNLWYNRCHQAIFYKRTIFNKFGKYNLKYKVLADYDLNLKWFLCPSIQCKYIPMLIAHFSEGGTSYKCKDDTFFEDFELKILKYGNRTFTINQKKEFARIASNKSDNIVVKLVLQSYVILLRIIDKCNRISRIITNYYA